MSYRKAEAVLSEWKERDLNMFGFHEEEIGFIEVDKTVTVDEEDLDPQPVTVRLSDGTTLTRPMTEKELEALRKVRKGEQ